MDPNTYKQGRGAQINPSNRFLQNSYETEEDYLEFLRINGEDTTLKNKTKYIEVHPKTIINKVDSPDIGAAYSMNPYQGCEHGCVYCYARNTHEYWGYSAGSEFEEVILVKKNAPELLEAQLQKPGWEPKGIMLSGNTDCYQPAEKKFEITRKILKVLLKYRHPVGLITKNALLIRDLDILSEMAKKRLVNVSISFTSLDEDLRRKMEPRTASAAKKLKAIRLLSEHNIPVNIMAAPMIPGLNSPEIFDLARETSKAGALAFNYTMVRLNGHISSLFMDWIFKNFPDRANKVKHLIESCHDGQLNDSTYGRRMRGDGNVAEQIAQMVRLARKKYFAGREFPSLNDQDFLRVPKGQFRMF